MSARLSNSWSVTCFPSSDIVSGGKRTSASAAEDITMVPPTRLSLEHALRRRIAESVIE